MIKLTSIAKGYSDIDVFLAKSHIVAIYPNRQGEGCYIEMSTNDHEGMSITHVREKAEDIVHCHF